MADHLISGHKCVKILNVPGYRMFPGIERPVIGCLLYYFSKKVQFLFQKMFSFLGKTIAPKF